MFSALIAFIFLLFLFPIYILVALIIFLDDGFPIIISQKRTGINDRVFDFYKFRTMKLGTPDVASKLLKSPGKYVLRSGRILRSWSLDEIPQLFNVMKGDMNFIGPRPLLDSEIDVISMRKNKNIHDTKPGITGWAQVNGRDTITDKEKVDYDNYYVLNKSIFFNLKILYLTFIKIILRKDISH
jgi:O-antigen biosynthesis protein WbqP